MRLADSGFIVTGGASGLGEATVRLLVAGGARVVIADLQAERGAALEHELGHNTVFARTDVTSEADARSAVQAAITRFGGLQGLVNCAGIAVASRIVGKDGPHALEPFVRTVTVNLIGTFNMIRLAAAAMAEAAPNEAGERGVIINTASIAAFDGQIGQAAYAASKGGVVGMTLPLARDLARHGIRVVTIAPGIFQTPMMSGLPPEAQESLGAMVPFPARLGRPGEYAALARHIIENEMLNGEVIRLDGALRMAPK